MDCPACGSPLTLELSDSVRDQACQLFRSAQNEDLLRGRSIEAIAAASVYGACRCNGLSRLVGEVSEMARVPESRVTNAYKTLNEELGLPAEPVSPSMFVPRLASDLECPDEIRQRARALVEQAEELGVTTGVHPAGFAAACLYTAGCEEGRWLTQTEVAGAANISTTTIRNHRDTLQQLDDKHRVGTKGDTEKREASAKSRGWISVVTEDIDNGRGTGVNQLFVG
jgi:transcription initiation factor TFIIB